MSVPFQALFDLFILFQVWERTFHHFSGTLGGSFSTIRNKQPAFSVPPDGSREENKILGTRHRPKYLSRLAHGLGRGLAVTSHDGGNIREYPRGTCRHPQQIGRKSLRPHASIHLLPCLPTPACFFSSLSGSPCGKVRVSCERSLKLVSYCFNCGTRVKLCT